MSLQKYSAFFEMLKSLPYLKKTSTTYNGGADTISRLMEYSEDYPDGWKLKEMQKVDFNGRKIGDPMPLKTFMQNYSISMDSIKTSLTAALGELARLSWIDTLKTRYGALYASVYLGKFGLEFNGEVFSPVFELPDEGNKSGDSFWLLAAEPKNNKKPTNELEARAIMILDGELTDDEVGKKAMHAIFQPIYRKWMKDMEDLMSTDPDNFQKRKTERPHLTENQFKSGYELIRNTGKKNFFIIFKSGRDEKTLVNSAKRGVRGFGDVETGRTIRNAEIGNKPIEKTKDNHAKFYTLKNNEIFWYYQVGSHKYMDENKYNLLTIVSVKGYNNSMLSVEVKKGNNIFLLNLKKHDKIKIEKKSVKGNKFVNAEITNLEKYINKVEIKFT